MGKFDKRLTGEKEGERSITGKRRKFLPVTDTKTERAQLTGLADKFLRERCVRRQRRGGSGAMQGGWSGAHMGEIITKTHPSLHQTGLMTSLI